jgi:hypothetical protein
MFPLKVTKGGEKFSTGFKVPALCRVGSALMASIEQSGCS